MGQLFHRKTSSRTDPWVTCEHYLYYCNAGSKYDTSMKAAAKKFGLTAMRVPTSALAGVYVRLTDGGDPETLYADLWSTILTGE